MQDICTGYFYEDNPAIALAGTKCVGSCKTEKGRWGSTWCNAKGGGWGAECVQCSGKHVIYESENVLKIIRIHLYLPSIVEYPLTLCRYSLHKEGQETMR